MPINDNRFVDCCDAPRMAHELFAMESFGYLLLISGPGSRGANGRRAMIQVIPEVFEILFPLIFVYCFLAPVRAANHPPYIRSLPGSGR